MTPLRRDINAIERHARDLLRQVEFFRRNSANEGQDEEVRVLAMELDVRRLAVVAGRARRRYYRNFSRK